MKEQVSWSDSTEEEESQELLQTSHETNVLPAKIPGMELEEDDEALQSIQKDYGPTQALLAVAALQNANLHDAVPDTSIAGVGLENFENLDPQIVTNNEDDADDAIM